MESFFAWMVELVDTRDLKSREPCARVGSSPTLGTSKQRLSGILLLESLCYSWTTVSSWLETRSLYL